ncbi:MULTISPECIES: thiamine pyrophosphate-dependent enzyme [Gammaproteobacteria]|uniref:thiamine pyrophosphate-dependent enzyme n=1 Tax=Gammaproteobacteria TaxID=1236 RepID=UPI000DD01CB7|nr:MULTISPECIES: thiamine pyrophosphate-dependent enzyme [Gammaproteobacteria]RTE86631.1 MFS transporter [Aliidiomarina sp. B3213]TCZ90814.1 MFS transporter [Lysobacter sp. N42]
MSLFERLNGVLFDTPLPEPAYTPDLESLGLTKQALADMVESQIVSRLLDLHSRELQAAGESFYTIGSAGHEGNAAVASALRINDMAFLHYRSGAFFVERQRKQKGSTPIHDMLLSFTASSEDPISSGRHKVLGSHTLYVPPQTSTIGSHLPKSMGMAYSIDLARRMNHQGNVPNDSVVLCSFGDASANHSTTQGAINAACWASFQSVPVPAIMLCEDNGIGISTATPPRWIEMNFKSRAGLHYESCDGRNLLDVYAATKRAERIARIHRKPVFLHMHCVRLYGHAGSDAEMTYLSKEQIAHNETQDPLRTSLALLEHYEISNREALKRFVEGTYQRIQQVGKYVVSRPKLKDAAEVMRDLAPSHPPLESPPVAEGPARERLFGHEKHNLGKPQSLNKLMNWALHDLMYQYPKIVMMGEDIGKKGGVYGVTSRLVQSFGKNRVINTLLDEQSILGLAIGTAHNGFLAMPEIQFLAYVHNAEDQIRGEAATLQFFSSAKFNNPMVIRIAGLAYQKGFGGHFHNDNSIALFRDLPGVVLACPSNGASAAKMVRECVRLADEQKRVVIFLEPIALYNTKDLHEAGDNLWLRDYPEPNEVITYGEVSTQGDGADIAIVSYANGFYLSCQAQRKLEDRGIKATVIDLNWLHPLPLESLKNALGDHRKVLIVDECRKSGSPSEGLMTFFQEQMANESLHVQRITADDSFIPLAKAAYHVLPSVEQIIHAAEEVVND